MAKDYYKTLGVSKSASKEEIKKAFRELAHKHHPDKGGDPARFKEANEAYQVLSDDKKRAEYDTYGHVFEGSQGAGPNPFEGFDFGGAGVEFDFGNLGNLNDIFSDFFGGARGTRRGNDISTEIQISFEESVFGVERKVLLVKTSVCKTCSGTGAEGKETKTCIRCNGKGTIRESRQSFLGSFSTTRSCQECAGSGKVPVKKCGTCSGSGVLRRQEEITIVVPAGIESGEIVRLQGMGEAIPHGQSGDLYIKVKVSPHKIFRKEGANLVMDLDIKLSDALLGKEINIETLEGQVPIKIPAGVGIGEVLKVRGAGVATSRGRGDLLIKLNIKLPQKLSKQARELIEHLREEGI